MPASTVLLTLAIIWLAAVAIGWILVVPILRRGPGGDPVNGLLWYVLKAYCRIRHRVTYSGLDLLPASDDDHDGLIVVSNHTGSVDPLLIQTACRFHIRWLMATDTMIPELDWLWKQQNLIPVERLGRDTAALREAIRHVRRGGCVGIFPEGRIPVPPREIRPYLPGVGALIKKTNAPVLLVFVSGTPDTHIMLAALLSTSNAHVHFVELKRFDDDDDWTLESITAYLRNRIHEVSGWPYNDELPPVGGYTNRT
jgi:1-acyl-sn-glycerol-3-phosphate acyltransferase